LTNTPSWYFHNTPWGYVNLRSEVGALRQDNKPKLVNRLKRIEGQVRGVARMIEEDRYCIDVLTQLQAVRAALARVETEMLKDHLGHCIESAIVSGDAAEQRQKASELIELLGRAAH
jgi:DNA-binding FrmR family transcriptional regulator